MNRLTLAAILAASIGQDAWDVPGAAIFKAQAPRYGRKPSGAAAAKRAAKRRRNIAKRLPK